jgi:hypothetical protein
MGDDYGPGPDDGRDRGHAYHQGYGAYHQGYGAYHQGHGAYHQGYGAYHQGYDDTHGDGGWDQGTDDGDGGWDQGTDDGYGGWDGPWDAEQARALQLRRRSLAGGGPARSASGGVVWRYRSAPLWVRVAADVTAAVLALGLIVGASLALRAGDGTEGATVTGVTTTTGPDGSSTTVDPSTTPARGAPASTVTTATTEPTTTAAPPTTTARTPATTPTTRPPAPTTTRPSPPTTNRSPHYDSCLEAWLAGALPLRRGDPGYTRHLDDDGDGIACERGEGF